MEQQRQNLKNGFYLLDIIHPKNNIHYAHLYKDGIRVNDTIFRAGGMCNGFKDGYCNLIKYDKIDKHTDFGTSVVVNEAGEIVLKSDNRLDYPRHLKGVIGTIGSKYYNLLTGELILKGDSSVKSENYLFVMNEYNKDYPKGVHIINWYTGEVNVVN